MEIKVKGNQLEAIEGMTTEYPYVLHHADMAKTRVPWHWHEELEFDYVINGDVKLITADNEYLFHKNQAFFINTNVLCTFQNTDEGQPAILDSHLFHSVFLSGHFRSIFETKYMDPVLKNKKLEVLEIRGSNDRQKDILKKLKQVSFLQRQEGNEFQTRNLFSDIWLLLLTEMNEMKGDIPPIKSANQERIQTMISFIQQNYQEKLSMESIAASASVSKRECLRCFQTCIHQTPFDYLLNYRMEMAEKLLRMTEIPIIEIASQTGFSSSAYFVKVFKNVYKKTPGAYRKSYLHSQNAD